jgi:hypothetical protein
MCYRSPAALLTLILTSLVLVLFAPAARAATAQQCLAAHEQSQVLRMGTELLEARDQMRRCADEDCPSVIRKDCLRWLEEIAEQIPTVVLEAVSENGAESDVKVYIGDKLLTEKLTGAATELDPGPYEFRFEFKGKEPKSVRVLLKQGDQNRSVTADFRPPPEPVKPGVPPPGYQYQVKPEVPKGTPTRPVPTLTYVLGGVAIVGAGVATYFGITAMSERKEAFDDCAPICEDSVKKKVDQKALISDIGTGVAVASAVTGAIIFLTRPTVYVIEEKPGKKAAPKKTSGLDWSLGATPKSASAGLSGSF